MASKCSSFGRQCLFGVALVLSLLPAQAAARGIWDGAQIEVITTDSQWVALPYAPGETDGLALDSKSRAYVIYTRDPGGRLYFMYKDPGQPWSPEIRLPASPTIEPHAGVVVGPDDRPEFLYLERGNYLVHATYDFGADQWSVDTITQSTTGPWPPWERVDIGVDSLGGFHVVWPDLVKNDHWDPIFRVMYAENTSGVWHKQIVTEVGLAPLLLVEPSGRALISYYLRRDEYPVFTANRSRGDTIWTADSIDTPPGVYGVADMRFGPDGSLHVLFIGEDCFGCMFIHRLFYTRRPPGSRVFDPWYQLFDHAGVGRLMVDCAGHAHVWYKWGDEQDQAPWMYYASNSSGAWVSGPFHFGSVPDDRVWKAALVLDRFDQARTVLEEAMDDRSHRLLYYAASTVYFDVLDIVRVIDHVYGGGPVCDPDTYDEDCNDTVDAADVVWNINYCFRNGPDGCRF